MGNLKSLALLALLFSLSLAVFADTSNDAATHAKEEVKPSEATDAIAPQQRGCRYGCCGAYAYGQCAACCSRPQAAEAETEANDVVVEPEQRGRGGCRYGCCGSYAFGRCSACCSKAQAEEAMKTEAVEENAVEPQQRGGGCMDVADHGVMDGAATVAEVLKPRLKLLSPSKSVDVGTVAAEGTLMRGAVFVVPKRWLQRKRRKRKKLSHELASPPTTTERIGHGLPIISSKTPSS
ncbi:LOW QUALITY PROTEIN: hypothetical protein Bca101_040568 [Brassica carinata]